MIRYFWIVPVFFILFFISYANAINLHPKGTWDTPGFKITNMTGNWYGGGGPGFDILGIIRNAGNETVNGVFLYVTQFDEKNNLIGVDKDQPLLDISEPNSSSPFKISFYPNMTGFDHYVVKVGK